MMLPVNEMNCETDLSSTYLITGGCGFIGSNLAHALVKQGHAVRILDNLSSGKKENLPPHCEYVFGDITDKNVLTQCLQGVSGCFHLAAVASVERSIQEWGASHLTNLAGTVFLIDAISRMHAPVPIVFASSAAVYGNSSESPLKESSPLLPLSPYGLDKLSSEKQLELGWNLYQIPSTAFRLFNVYGPRQNASSPYSGVISIFAKKIKENQNLVIFGDGQQIRDFIFVNDVVAYFIAAMKSGHQGAQVFNLGSGKGTSINGLVTALETLLGRPVKKEYAPKRIGDIGISIANIDPATGFFGFKPQTLLEKGLTAYLESL